MKRHSILSLFSPNLRSNNQKEVKPKKSFSFGKWNRKRVNDVVDEPKVQGNEDDVKSVTTRSSSNTRWVDQSPVLPIALGPGMLEAHNRLMSNTSTDETVSSESGSTNESLDEEDEEDDDPVEEIIDFVRVSTQSPPHLDIAFDSAETNTENSEILMDVIHTADEFSDAENVKVLDKDSEDKKVDGVLDETKYVKPFQHKKFNRKQSSEPSSWSQIMSALKNLDTVGANLPPAKKSKQPRARPLSGTFGATSQNTPELTPEKKRHSAFTTGSWNPTSPNSKPRPRSASFSDSQLQHFRQQQLHASQIILSHQQPQPIIFYPTPIQTFSPLHQHRASFSKPIDSSDDDDDEDLRPLQYIVSPKRTSTLFSADDPELAATLDAIQSPELLGKSAKAVKKAVAKKQSNSTKRMSAEPVHALDASTRDAELEYNTFRNARGSQQDFYIPPNPPFAQSSRASSGSNSKASSRQGRLSSSSSNSNTSTTSSSLKPALRRTSKPPPPRPQYQPPSGSLNSSRAGNFDAVTVPVYVMPPPPGVGIVHGPTAQYAPMNIQPQQLHHSIMMVQGGQYPYMVGAASEMQYQQQIQQPQQQQQQQQQQQAQLPYQFYQPQQSANGPFIRFSNEEREVNSTLKMAMQAKQALAQRAQHDQILRERGEQ
ncbi:UNVERIFIED_CONTAM: hypothetical protein HDU68_011687 [Siphonaria sp. JEL0065]|nr:hypothetical protein HDU68_011687 [Siphonaria sp. JEL0065]